MKYNRATGRRNGGAVLITFTHSYMILSCYGEQPLLYKPDDFDFNVFVIDLIVITPLAAIIAACVLWVLGTLASIIDTKYMFGAAIVLSMLWTLIHELNNRKPKTT